MATHYLKTWPVYFEAVADGTKNFEVRRNDRNFQVGDYLVLQEFDPATMQHSGRNVTRQIQYVLEGGGEDAFGLADGHAVLGLVPELLTTRIYHLEVAVEDALSVAENTVPGFDLKLSPWCDLAAAVEK